MIKFDMASLTYDPTKHADKRLHAASGALRAMAM
jgi:hypothetical protein